MPKEKHHAKGIISDLVGDICLTYGLDEAEVKSRLVARYPQLTNKAQCPNCQAHMDIDEFKAGAGEAQLLIRMAQEVRKKTSAGVPFTEANKVHVPTLDAPDQIRHACTRAAYLNLIKQPEDMSNSGYWLITSWGWKALRGEAIPKSVQYFRKQLIARSSETTTLPEMLRTHIDKAKRAAARRREVETGIPELLEKYSPREWVEFAGFAEGFGL